MAEHLRALVVILVLACAVFVIAKRPACDLAFTSDEFSRRWKLWFGVTLIAFLSHNFWLYVLLMGALLLIMRIPHDDKFPIFIFLLFAVPPFSKEIPGFGGIRFLLDIDHVRVLTFVLLLPLWWWLRRQPDVIPFGRTWVDKAVLGYLAIGLTLHFLSDDTFTNWARTVVYRFIDVFLPYYVASRSLRDVESFRKVAMSFVLAALLLASIAFFEFARHWLLYNALPGALGAHFNMGNYLARGDSIRALASTGHSIALGYVMMVAMGLLFFLRKSIQSPLMWKLAMVALATGLISAIARGPWVAALIAFFVILLTGPDKLSRIARVAAVGLPLLAVILMSPYGADIIDRLPFIGTVDAQNVDYRQRLFDVSMNVLMQHPWFGVPEHVFAMQMEEMRQGEGIVDMVNSYLGVALSGGLVTFAFFAGFFGFSWLGVAKTLTIASDKTSEMHLLGRALLAVLTGIMVTIATVSSILTIPMVYWCIGGACVAYMTADWASRSAVDASPTFEQRRGGWSPVRREWQHQRNRL